MLLFSVFIISLLAIAWFTVYSPSYDSFAGEADPVSNRRVATVSMMKDPKNIEEWLKHHRDMGIVRFYIRLEETPELDAFLQAQPDVVVMKGSSTGKNEYSEIQVRQKKMVDAALAQGLQSGDVDWLIHIDADELLHGSLDEIYEMPASARTFWMQNEEAVYENIPGKKDSCFDASEFRNCDSQGVHCVSYVNGKGGGRVTEDVSLGGPHRFDTSKPGNQQIKLEKLVVRHFESCDYESYRKKFMHLAKNDDTEKIPFSYYNESIEAARTGDENALQCVYTKHRTVKGDLSDSCL